MTDDRPQRPRQVPAEQIGALMAEAEVKQARYAAYRAERMKIALAADDERQARVDREAVAQSGQSRG